MYRQLTNAGHFSGIIEPARGGIAVAHSGELETLVALEGIGTRLSFSRNQEIYIEGDASDCWYKVVSGTVRICKLLADGRRHIAEFCFSGDCFGLDSTGSRVFSAEAVSDTIVLRLPRKATEQLMDQNPALARLLRETMLRDLANAHSRMLLLGRMTAPERVAAFLLEIFERRDVTKALGLPMSRTDITDYLGLMGETVCRTLSMFRHERMIAISNPQRIELLDRAALETIGKAQ